jgi:hypothetical protein
MAFSAQYGDYNVQASFNNWFVTRVTANGTPAWMPSARVVFDYGTEKPLFSGYSGHAFSVTHFESNVMEPYQGRNVDNGSLGHTRRGMVEIDVWINKNVAGSLSVARMRQACDMVSRLLTSARSVPISDFYSSTANPPSLSASIRLHEFSMTNPIPDVNPDVIRTRFVIPYTWVYRS